MLRNKLRHVEHRHLGFAAEYDLQVRVSVDVSPVLLVLKVILLDVYSKLLHDLGAGYRFGSDDFAERFAGLQRLHECRICFSYHSGVPPY